LMLAYWSNSIPSVAIDVTAHIMLEVWPMCELKM
jgi:hypothetical protein